MPRGQRAAIQDLVGSLGPNTNRGETFHQEPLIRRPTLGERLNTETSASTEICSDGEETPLAFGIGVRTVEEAEEVQAGWADETARRFFGIQVEAFEDQKDSFWSFIDSGTFQTVSALVILVNTIMIAAETSSPAWKRSLHGADQIVLVFYVFELVGRLNYFGRYFFLTSWHMVAWNMLDLAVVIAGITDQWIVPLVVGNSSSNSFIGSIRALRLLRLLRVLKMVRILMEADLAWTEEPWFESFVGAVIVFNAIIMGFETDNEWYGWFYIEQVLLLIYTFELSVRLKRFGLSFFSNESMGWNLLDFAIVSSSVIDSWLMPTFVFLMPSENKGSQKSSLVGKTMILMRMLRLMRILRLVRVIKSVRPLFNLVMGVVAAMQGVGWVLVLTLVTLYAAGILATRLIGHGDCLPDGVHIDDNVLKIFSSVLQSMFVLFRLMNGSQSDEEAFALDTLMTNIPFVKFGFVFFMVTYTWTLLSILTAVVSDNMISVTTEQAMKDQKDRAEEARRRRMMALKELFADIDEDGSGTLEEHELEAYMENPTNSSRWEHLSGIPTTDVPTLLSTLSSGKDPVSLDFFIDILTDSEATSITERAVLKLRGGVEDLHQEFEAFRAKQQTCQGEVIMLLRQIVEATKPSVHAASHRAVADAAVQAALTRMVSLAQAEQTKVLHKILEVLPRMTLPAAAERLSDGAAQAKNISWEDKLDMRLEMWVRKHEEWQAAILQKINDMSLESKVRAIADDAKTGPRGWLPSEDLFQRL